MRKLIILITLSIVAISSVSAQNAFDVYNYSVENRAYATARVASMGGAFTSLGADPSAAMINPAGLGLYRSGELSTTMSNKWTNVNNYATVGRNSYYNTRTETSNFNFNNLNAVFNAVDKDYGVVRSLNFALGYNLNHVQTMNVNSRVENSDKIILDHFVDQLNDKGLNPGGVSSLAYSDISPAAWGAYNAYRNGDKTNSVIDINGNKFELNPSAVNSADRFELQHKTHIQGRNETYNFSTGMQFGDYVNVGISLGVADYSYASTVDYYEIAQKANSGKYDAMGNYQGLVIDGISFDFRVGVIVEPIAGLRIGASYHAPKAAMVDETYFSDQQIEYLDVKDPFYNESPYSTSNYKMVSPSKMLTGISYVINGYGIISFDYERVWYNAMKVGNIDGSDIVNTDINDTFKPTDAFYLGAEAYIGNNIFLRGGYNFTTSPFVDSAQMVGYDGSSWSVTAGLGYRAESFYIDLAYIYSPTESAFSYYGAVDAPISSSEIFSHIFSFTFGWKF